MWDKYPLYFPTRMCVRHTSPTRSFLQVSTRSRKSARQRVGHADQGIVGREAQCVTEVDRNGKSPHVEVKGEFVGKPVPLDGNQQTGRR